METLKEITLKLPWLNNLPSNWKIGRGKRLFVKMQRSYNKDDETVTAFRDGQVTLRKNRRVEGFTESIKEHGYQGVQMGDLVIHAMDGFAGAIGVSDSNGKCSPVYSICRPRNKDSQYYYSYLLRFLAHNNYILSLAKGIRERSTDFRFEDFGNLILPVPPRFEQDAIVKFLDEKIADIDKYISAKQKLIALLNEQKAAIINQAVTKGIDPNVKMRDSENEWLGEIPEDWEIRRLKYLGKVVNGATPDSSVLEYWNGDIKWATPTDISKLKNWELVDTERKITYKGYKSCGTTLVDPHSIILTTRAPIGNLAFNIEAVCTNQGCKSITKIKINYKYLLYFLISKSKLLDALGLGTTFKELSSDSLKSLSIAYPDVNEQQKIIDFIESNFSKIDQVKLLIDDDIKMMQEYKQSIIAEGVTGKLKIT